MTEWILTALEKIYNTRRYEYGYYEYTLQNAFYKPFFVTVNCAAFYSGRIMVPPELSEEESIQYAREHMENIQRTSGLELLRGSEEINEEFCEFEK